MPAALASQPAAPESEKNVPQVGPVVAPAAVPQPGRDRIGGRRGFETPVGVKKIADVVYATVKGAEGEDLPLKLDVYVPEKVAEGERARPLVVWIHGGGWQGGSKDRCPANRLVLDGYVVASIQYRLTDVAPWPAQIQDCKGAIRWLKANAEKYGIDASRVGVWGSSAGGHLAAMLGLTTPKDDLMLEGEVGGNAAHSSSVQAVVNWFGPSDLVKMVEGIDQERDGEPGPMMKLAGGKLSEKMDVLRQASPVIYASKDDAPMLIMHGTEDRLVPMEQSVMLRDALQKAGARVELIEKADSGHGNGGFMRLATLAEVKQFLDVQLKTAPAK
ncbi:MAG: alpha/beta hydrolase [Planctomycetes bacterium]|nr:alpha/beta hydrolase [Planctomycetota bacterium]